jgi:hypothetical protein
MAYTDWIDIVEDTILEKANLPILEFGLGQGTEYLVNNFKSVYSYELIDNADPSLEVWSKQCITQFSSSTNWNYEVVKYDDIAFEDYNPKLATKLLTRIDELFNKYKFEAVLVDGGYHVRGDIANYILNKFAPSYVIIHDTNYNYEVDGYCRIELPANYTTVKYTQGEGTHIFVKIKKVE